MKPTSGEARTAASAKTESVGKYKCPFSDRNTTCVNFLTNKWLPNCMILSWFRTEGCPRGLTIAIARLSCWLYWGTRVFWRWERVKRRIEIRKTCSWNYVVDQSINLIMKLNDKSNKSNIKGFVWIIINQIEFKTGISLELKLVI